MTPTIRNLRAEEFETFMRFLNRCYDVAPGALERYHPQTYRPTGELRASTYVIEDGSEIVSHVGLYPIEVVVCGVPLRIGGIGGVATAHAARGKGHMTKLLYHVIDVMREQGYVLSWLGGDRQRYNTFGWERAGVAYDLKFSRRALDRAGVRAVAIEEQVPAAAADTVARYQSLPVCHARRPHLALQLRKQGLRLWTAEDGYAIAGGPDFGALSIRELVSASGHEAGMIRALLEWTGRDEISWTLPGCDHERLSRVMPGATHWRVGGWEMYRIVDLYGLLVTMEPILSHRAAPLRDLELSIGVREHDRTDVVTLTVRDGQVGITRGRSAEGYVEWSSVEAARTMLGGAPPAAGAGVPRKLVPLLPLPVYVPELDHV